jgi:hypothetical protein
MYDVRCYLIVEKFNTNEDTTDCRNGELVGLYSDYANLTSEFYKIGYADQSYNCMNYALDDYDDSSLGDGSLVTTYVVMANHNYYIDSQVSNNCIVAYGVNSYVWHVAKIENGIVTAKLGKYREKVQHPNYDSYISENYVDKWFFAK